jgi:hypothetical protein
MTVAQPIQRTSNLFDETQHIFRKVAKIYFLNLKIKLSPFVFLICLILVFSIPHTEKSQLNAAISQTRNFTPPPTAPASPTPPSTPAPASTAAPIHPDSSSP